MGSTSTNGILFTFIVFFFLIATFQPFIKNEYENSNVAHNVGDIENEVQQAEIESVTDLPVLIEVIISLIFWVIGAPFWINVIITAMRIVFWIIVYDKVRGISS